MIEQQEEHIVACNKISILFLLLIIPFLTFTFSCMIQKVMQMNLEGLYMYYKKKKNKLLEVV